MMVLAVLLVLACVTKCSTMSRHELDDFADFLKKTSVLDQNLKDGTTADEDLISDHAWEESGKFEGDLILNERQRRLIVEDVAEGLSRNGLRDSTKRWPDNEVVYYIQREHFSGDQVQAIMDGIDDLARASCVKFRPYKKGDRDAVVVQGSRRGCFSQVGYQGGYQVLNLSGRHPVGRGCFRHGTVVHEFLHTLGFYHMQSSPDRDDYIDVMWENIVEPAKHNFRKYNTFSVSDFGVGYDYDSVLHYSRKAFSKNGGDTLVPKQAAEIGQRTGISDKDSQKLNKMYCDADNNEQSDPHIIHKVTKKKPKNQPFQGHGIGYHKGKTVVIKLPAAKTFNLRDNPANHVFDYFSKAPKALPPTLAEGAGIGKKVTYTIVKEHRYERPTITSYLPRQTEKLKPTGDPPSNTSKKTHSKSPAKDALQPVKDLKSKELIEAFERLGMIIKSHVYPSQAPITEMYTYKYDKDFSDFVTPGLKSETLPEIKTIDELFRSNNNKKTSKPVEKLSEDSNVTKDREKLEIVSHPKKNNDRELVHKYKFGEVDDSFGTSLPFRKLIEKSRNSTPDYTFHSDLNVGNTEKYKPSFKSYYKGTENPQTTIDKNKSQIESDAEVGHYLRVKETPEIDYHAVFSIPQNFKFAEKEQQYSKLYEPKKKTDETADDSPVQTKQYKLFGETVPLAEPWFQSNKRGQYELKKTEPTVDEDEPEIKKDAEKYNEAEPTVKTYDYGYEQVDDSNEDSRHDDGDSKSIEELVMQKVNKHYTENHKSHSEEDDISSDTKEGEQGSVKVKDHVKIIDKARTSSETDNSDERKSGEKSDAQRPKFSSYSKTWDDAEKPTSFERAKLESYNYYRDSREQKESSSPSTTSRATPYRVTDERNDEVDDNDPFDSSDNEGDSNNTKSYRRNSSQSESIEQEEPRFGPLGSVEKTIDDRLKDVLSSYKEYDKYDITSPIVGHHRHKSSEENIRHVRASSIVKPVKCTLA